MLASCAGARTERSKLRIGLLFCRVNDLSLVQEMRSERHHLFSRLDSGGHDDFLLTDGGNLHEPELHFRLALHDPDARPATATLDRPDWPQAVLLSGGRL